MDIGSGTGYPSANLSNFSPHVFTVDGIECNSMEGFLQSLKFQDPEMQKHVCTLVGKKAKFKGKKKKWWKTQTLYWKGEDIVSESINHAIIVTYKDIQIFNFEDWEYQCRMSHISFAGEI